MRILLLLFFCFVVTVCSHSQTIKNSNDQNIFKNFADTLNGKLDSFENVRNQIISWDGFDSLSKPIFGKVILGNNNLINQGSAYALSVDQFQSVFSLNYSLARNKKDANKGYFNMGFNASSSSKLFQLFTRNTWSQGISLSFGIIMPKRTSFTFMDPTADIVRQKRKIASIGWLSDVKQLLLTDTSKLRTNINNVDSFYIKHGKHSEEYDKALAATTLANSKAYNDAKDSISKIKTFRTADANKAVGSYIDSLNANFEKAAFSDFPYTLTWWTYNVVPEYKGVSIYDTLVAKTVGVKRKDYFRVGFNLSWNYMHSGKKFLFYSQLGCGIKNSNSIEGKKPTDVQSLFSNVTTSTDLVDNGQAVIVANYDDYKKQFALLMPNGGLDLFFGEKRIIGYELFGSANIGLKKKEIPFKSTFSARTGFLFSLNGKSDLAKSTFALLAQWDNLEFNKPSIKDNFSLGLRIGIPFNN